MYDTPHRSPRRHIARWLLVVVMLLVLSVLTSTSPQVLVVGASGLWRNLHPRPPFVSSIDLDESIRRPASTDRQFRLSTEHLFCPGRPITSTY